MYICRHLFVYDVEVERLNWNRYKVPTKLVLKKGKICFLMILRLQHCAEAAQTLPQNSPHKNFSFVAMEAQKAAFVLTAVCAGVNILCFIRGLCIFKTLEKDAMVPIHFGFLGKVNRRASGRGWFLIYPTLSLLMAVLPIIRAFIWSKKAPNSTSSSSPELLIDLTDIIGMAIGLSCILAGALFWLIMEEVPRIVKEEQDGLRPRFIILCYIIAQLGTVASAAIAIKLTIWISRKAASRAWLLWQLLVKERRLLVRGDFSGCMCIHSWNRLYSEHHNVRPQFWARSLIAVNLVHSCTVLLLPSWLPVCK